MKVNQQLITTKENSRSLPFKKNIQNMLSGGFTTNNSWIVKILKPMEKNSKKKKQKQYFHSKVTGLNDQGIGLGTSHVLDIIACKKDPRFFNEASETTGKCDQYHPGNYQIEISNMYMIKNNPGNWQFSMIFLTWLSDPSKGK